MKSARQQQSSCTEQAYCHESEIVLQWARFDAIRNLRQRGRGSGWCLPTEQVTGITTADYDPAVAHRARD